jgi:hypothetical protein
VVHVVHEVGRHHDLLAHHVGEGEHRTVGVEAEELVDDARVGDLVARLVGRNRTADLAKRLVAELGGEARGVAMRDLGRALL